MRSDLTVCHLPRAGACLLFLAYLLALTATSVSAVSVQEKSRSLVGVNQTLYWGTYRSNLYFGTRARSPDSPLVGMMWLAAHTITQLSQLRHGCEEGDGLDSYGWVRHDGINFGEQVLVDSKSGVRLNTTFLKHIRGENGGEWVARITGEPTDLAGHAAVSLFFYVAVPPSSSLRIAGLSGTSKKKGLAGSIQIEGQTEELGSFSVLMRNAQENTSPSNADITPHKIKGLPDLSNTHFYGYNSDIENMWNVKGVIEPILGQERQRIFEQYIQLSQKDSGSARPNPILFHPTLPNTVTKNANVIVVQRVFNLPLETDLVFVSHSAHPSSKPVKPKSKKKKKSAESAAAPSREFTEDDLRSWELTGEEVLTAVGRKRQEFESHFEEAFGLGAKGFTDKQRDFAMSTMSNLIGGISYFHGQSIVLQRLRDGRTQPVYSPAKSLYTAVPSRPFFPRGFLWDEGFHQLLVRQWSPLITGDVLRHWFELQDRRTGWIAREQILGIEARSKVPAEFQAQDPTIANPPTLLFPLSASIRAIKQAQAQNDGASGIILDHSNINAITSFGVADTTDASDELSFLQDSYEHLAMWFEWWLTTQKQAVVDVFQWNGRTVNHTFASGLDDYPRAETPSQQEEHVDLLSWMMFFARTMADISELLGHNPALYTDTYRRLETQLQDCWSEQHMCYCDADGRDVTTGDLSLVCHKGYISIFPMMLGLVPPGSPNLGALLDLIRDENHLWSGYGVRSLSKSDRYFGQGENYWKGPIWINMNYLILSSLHNYYASRPGPYQERAKAIYEELRAQIIGNMYKEYVNTGYVWEQYNPINGKGQRSHPFTGWSALVVLIMAEQYPEKYPLS